VIAGAIGGWKKRAMALLLCRPPLQQHPQGCSRGSLIYDDVAAFHDAIWSR